MDNKKFIEELNSTTESVKLSETNKKFMKIIEDPNSYEFHHSRPGKYNPPSPQNEGETAWQRELYKMESDIWLDLELPIGQYKKSSNRLTSLRADLIGKKDGRFILCELKKTKNAGLPFDAILQLIAYHLLLQNNYKRLDEQNIHHTNCNFNWKWADVKDNHVLWLRANNEYWGNWHKCTKKNEAARKIVKLCLRYNMDILLFSDEREICVCE